MISRSSRSRRACLLSSLIVIGLSTIIHSSQVQSESCSLPNEHAGVTFSIEHVDLDWACRLQVLVDNYTIANKVGPLRAGLSESVYRDLLDRPPLVAALINRLNLGLYKSEARGPDRFWGNDGEGTGGIVQLVYQNRTARIYYLEGAHDSRLLPRITGKAVVFLKMTPVKEADGMEVMDSTMVSYARLDNRILSGVVSLLRPFLGGIVARKLSKAVETVNRLSILMRQHPDRVLFVAMDPPPFSDEDLALVKQALENLSHPVDSAPPRTPSL